MKKKVGEYGALTVSVLMLIAGIIIESLDIVWFDYKGVKLIWTAAAYIPVAFPVIKEAVEDIQKGEVFSEFTLMTIATAGAFLIGEYPEGVAVMLFYAIGEKFQDHAVDKAKRDIKALVDIRPERASVIIDGIVTQCKPEVVQIGDMIEVKPGERVSLDGVLLSDVALFNTSALTGESVPKSIQKDGEVLAGMISTDSVVRIRVTRLYAQSALSRILDMVREATDRKAPAELFISRFAQIYTPVVIVLAALTVLIPYLYSLLTPTFVYSFNEWFYRALIFLVISCPCALVVSVPLSYFGGIGLASRKGILFKGGNYIDAILNVDTVVFDKTGTLTTGIFAVTEVKAYNMDSRQLVNIAAAMERTSNHPVAKAIVAYDNAHNKPSERLTADHVKDIPGYGITGKVDDDDILVGSLRMMDKYGVGYPEQLKEIAETIVVCSKNGHLIGYILLSDALKEDALKAVKSLRELKIRNIQILSGDKQALVDTVVRRLKADKGYGDLLPEGKVEHITRIKYHQEKVKGQSGKRTVAFVGDGINDAPVLAMSDVGIAVGGAGSDVAIETADVVLQDARPSKLAEAIVIARHTRRNVIENITIAIGVKIVVLLLGVLGIATMWEAVFADVGVTVLAVFNALRLIRRG
jgi:Cd2+/Zn2+-exporting ATPase